MSKLYFRYGAMNSGKKTMLLQTAHNYEEQGMKIFLIKPVKSSVPTNLKSNLIQRDKIVAGNL